MKLEFHPEKDAANRKNHGLSLADVERFDLAGALIQPDQRRDYGEDRFRAFGLMDGRMHALVFTLRGGDTIRAISFRKANRREENRYGK